MKNWTKEQDEVLNELNQGIALIAGAGSGKTAVLVEYYLRLLKKGYQPHEILVLTFTEDAAKELVLRLETALRPNVFPSRFVTTFHGFCFDFLSQHFELPVKRILTPFEIVSLWDQTFKKLIQNQTDEALAEISGWFTPLTLHRLLKATSERRTLLEPLLKERLLEEPPVRLWQRLALEFFSELDRVTINQGLFQFSDLERCTLQKLTRDSEVREQYRKQFKKILVDEVQDTSPEQYLFLNLLTQDTKRKLFLVGDPKQSIYRFRGADLELFLSEVSHRETQALELFKLTCNFRSQAQILSFCNRFAENYLQFKVALDLSLKLGQESPDLGNVHYHFFGGDHGEIETIAQILKNQIDLEKESVALLFRVKDKIRTYTHYLTQADFAVSSKYYVPLFQSQQVHNLVTCLNLLSGHFDPIEVMSLLNFFPPHDAPKPFTCEEEWFSYLESKGALSWWQRIRQSEDISLRDTLIILFQEVNVLSQHSSFVLSFLEGCLEYLHLPLRQFVPLLALWQKHDIQIAFQGNENSNISLMTVHGAKGLEFDHVFLVDNYRLGQRQLSPLLISHPKIGICFQNEGEIAESNEYKELKEIEKQALVEESKRLLYVALTRARKQLHIMLPEKPPRVVKNTWGEWLLNLRETKCQNQS